MYDEQLQREMTGLLLAWQKWEIAFIFGNTEWKGSLPQFTPEIFAEYINIQSAREEILEKIEKIMTENVRRKMADAQNMPSL